MSEPQKCDKCDGKGTYAFYALPEAVNLSCHLCLGSGLTINCKVCIGSGKILAPHVYRYYPDGTENQEIWLSETCMKCAGKGSHSTFLKETQSYPLNPANLQ